MIYYDSMRSEKLCLNHKTNRRPSLGGLSLTGFTLIELIMVIVIIGILAAIAIPKMSGTQMLANDSAAKANIETISAALETYATSNNGNYPTAETDLTNATPSYLNQSFCGKTISGYSYSCTLTSTSYTVTATPASCGSSGSKTFTVTTGGALSSSGC